MAQFSDAHPYPPSDDSFDDLYERIPNDPAFCVGHLDRSTDTEHNTPLDHFGPDGLAVVQRDGHPAGVSFADFSLRGTVSTPRARLVAMQILEACALADRYPRKPSTDNATG